MTEPQKAAVWNQQPLDGVQRVIAVASGKGGVGKSTTTVMLAHHLTQIGVKVGILDADIYGPSIPRMLGLSGKPHITTDAKGVDKMLPLVGHGIACNSMGFLLEENQAAIWRGPMISKALHQLARLTLWSEATQPLSHLFVDMPPGTGDIHLSMVQQVPLNGVLLVTTPQDVALQDARKCADMFSKANVPILGVIENMSWFEDSAGIRHTLFGAGGGAKLAAEWNVPLLAKIPQLPELVTLLDQGKLPPSAMIGCYPMV
jgi:ATP-binding protein involved in chromosome partitioning